MPPIDPLLREAPTIISRVGRFIERQLPTLFHPEQLLMRGGLPGKALYQTGTHEARNTRFAAEATMKGFRQIYKNYGIADPESANQLFSLVEFPQIFKRMPTAQEYHSFPEHIRKAAIEHLDLTDKIWKIAKEADPNIGYIRGYVPHSLFPAKQERGILEDEIKRLQQLIQDQTEVGAHRNAAESKAQLVYLRDRLSQATGLDNEMAIQRARIIPGGKYFGPMDETRKIPTGIIDDDRFRRDYMGIMEEYVHGAYRKIFLDRFLPQAKELIKRIPDPAIREYAYDYVTSQRGSLGARQRTYMNSALRQLFPNTDPNKVNRYISRAVDEVTRFQYMTKIGLSWVRFPIVNMSQPILTLYPLVGEKIFVQALHDALSPKMWDLAKKAGATFEPTVRRAVSEAYGRHHSWAKLQNVISYPATWSEKFNRTISFAAGLRQGETLGLKGTKLVDHALDLVDRTQFIYQKEALPLIMTKSQVGRLAFQFRTFTANYVNYLVQMFNDPRYSHWSKNPAIYRTIAALGVLSGSSIFPLWKETRLQLLRHAGIDIGEYNPIQRITAMFGLPPGVNLGPSMEPFNPPDRPTQLAGPTFGQLGETFFQLKQHPENAAKILKQQAWLVAPPIRTYSRILDKEATREGRVKGVKTDIPFGKRPILEKMYLRPSLESVRGQYLRLIANAIAGKRMDLVPKLIKEGRSKGLYLNEDDLKIARTMATNLTNLGD